MSQAILVESFPREKHGMAMAVFGMGVVVAPVIGPTLGGWITDNYTWRWIFFINIPVGILSLLLTQLLVFDPPYLVRRSFRDGLKIDYIGFGLLAARAGLARSGARRRPEGRLVRLALHRRPSPSSLAVCLIAVVFWELRQEHPVIDFRMLKERNFTLATLSMLVLGFVLYGSTTLLPMFLQTLLGYTAMLSGLVLSPGGLVVIVCLPMVGILLRQFQARWLVIFGVLVSAGGLFIMSRFNLGDRLSAPRSGAAWCRASAWPSCSCPSARRRSRTSPGSAPTTPPGCSTWRATSAAVPASPRPPPCWRAARRCHQQVLVAHLTPYDPAYRDALVAHTAMLHAHGARIPDAGPAGAAV